MNNNRGNPKHPRYQDYVIKDGRLVGEFEAMYQDYDDPWEQTTRELHAHEKLIGKEIIRQAGYKRVLELGCGFGHYTAQLATVTESVLGVDVSETAVHKAQNLYPDLDFVAADILDVEVFRRFRPDCVVMAEISWYVLDKLAAFKSLLHEEMRGGGLVHLLMTYAPGEQQYGREYFTDLPEIMRWWSDGVDFQEWGQIASKAYNGGSRTYCFGTIL